jgi:hypothetical protein
LERGGERVMHARLPRRIAGVCNATTLSCECYEGFETGVTGSCDTEKDAEEPFSMLPLIVAGIGLFTFILVVSVLRLLEVSAGKANGSL